MIFTSLDFALFLPVVFILYWFIFNRSGKSQNILLLLAGLFFYGYADWRFLFLIVGNALLNYFIGIQIAESKKENIQRRYLWTGVIINLGVLGFFKYFNFFYDNFVDLINLFGFQANHSTLMILLPLGISFFTFQTLGYIIDVYNEEIDPTRDLLAFTTYVLYFPKLLAGPIERAQKFLPQIATKRVFDKVMASDGLRQILWGLFAKVVIADNLATITDGIYSDYYNQSTSALITGTFYYMMQIYCDFAGYSNIAIGVSKLFGIRLMVNFATPFFSTNISDFWKKWHISLTSWLMDYVFTPLSFILRRQKKWGLFLSIMITFILVGFWHGAKWTFIIFGILQGLYFLPMVIKGSVNSSSTLDGNKLLPSLKDFLKMVGLFILINLTVVFFRADDAAQAFGYIINIFASSGTTSLDPKQVLWIPVILLFLAFEWVTRDKEHALQLENRSVFLRWSLYLLFGFIVVLAYDNNPVDFIYLQF